MPGLIELLAAYGLAFGLQHKAKFLHGWTGFTDRLLACIYCTGFHCGWMVWLLSWASGHQTVDWAVAPHILMWCFATAGFCYATDAAIQWLERPAPP
jgi:hypothetical protein